MSNERDPGKVYFTDFIDQEAPKGWCNIPRKLFILGFPKYRLRALSDNALTSVKDIRRFFYHGFHPPYYPHLACTRSEPLHLVQAAVAVVRGSFEKTSLDDSYGESIRPTWGYISINGCEAIPGAIDSRTVWPGSSHDEPDYKKSPHNIILLPDLVLRHSLAINPEVLSEVMNLSGS